MARWMQIDGKFCSVNSWFNAMQRLTALTKMTTCKIMIPVDVSTTTRLIELELIEQFEELLVLLVLLQLDVVLLESVQRQLRLVVHVHFHRLE